jgi:hypothetical protein
MREGALISPFLISYLVLIGAQYRPLVQVHLSLSYAPPPPTTGNEPISIDIDDPEDPSLKPSRINIYASPRLTNLFPAPASATPPKWEASSSRLKTGAKLRLAPFGVYARFVGMWEWKDDNSVENAASGKKEKGAKRKGKGRIVSEEEVRACMRAVSPFFWCEE